MTIEFQILDLIQNLHTPAGDVIFLWISKLGNGGFIWIVLAAGLLVFPRTRKAGAVLIAFSRLYLYVHYPTDILGGMAAGAVAGYLGAYGIRKVEQWRQKRKKMA